MAPTEEDRVRFLREAQAASRLDHPNICTVYQVDETPEGHVVIAMPLYDGETLTERIRRGALDHDEIVRIASQVGLGLFAAHEAGIVHRDIKSSNIMLTRSGQAKIIISSDEGLRKAMLWIFGDLSMSEWSKVTYGLAFVLPGLLISLFRAKALNALILGDEFAHSLGFAPHRERSILFVAVGLLTAASVSLGGMIGFIGLLVPHIIRSITGSDSRLLIPFSAIGGGGLLCIADLISRSVLAPTELPAGIVTAIIGSPYFLYLLRRKNVLSI